MTNLDVPRSCIFIRPGIEIWVDEKKANSLPSDISANTANKFIKIDGNLVNTVEIVGIFKPNEIDELRKKERGMWKCKYNNWHTKTEYFCECGKLG